MCSFQDHLDNLIKLLAEPSRKSYPKAMRSGLASLPWSPCWAWQYHSLFQCPFSSGWDIFNIYLYIFFSSCYLIRIVDPLSVYN